MPRAMLFAYFGRRFLPVKAALTGGTSGNITVHGNITRKFDENKDYLYPVPTDDRVLTGGVVSQNPGWEDGLSF